MSDQLRKYYTYKETVQRISCCSGLWPSVSGSRLYGLLSFIHVVVIGLGTFAVINFCLHNSGNFNLFIMGLAATFGYWAVLQRTICAMVYRKRLFKLHSSLDSTFNEELQDSALRPILLSPLRMFRSLTFPMIIVTLTLQLIWCITPLIAFSIQYIQRVDELHYSLPYPTVYPWSINGWRYPAHYIFHLHMALSLSVLGTSTDALFVYYIFQICGQLRTLSHRIANIKPCENYHKLIRDCVVKHNLLTRCQKHVERIYGPIVINMLVISAIIICLLTYQATHMNFRDAGTIFFFIIVSSMRPFVYGTCGSILTVNADAFRQAIYVSDWAGCGEKSFMIDILVMITYKPSPMIACSLSTISVDMFVAICNTAVSYFFMLRTLEEGRKA